MEVDPPRNNKDKGKKPMQYDEHGNEICDPAQVQPIEDLMSIQLVPGDPEKTIRVGSRLGPELADHRGLSSYRLSEFSSLKVLLQDTG